MGYPVPGHASDSTENVVALLRGTDPALRHDFIIITAHLDGLGTVPNAPAGSDSVLNGADDNASGVAALLEIARALAASGQRPRRSILFAAVSGEETGLWGSEYLLSLSQLQVGRVTANLNMDMIGRARGDSVFLVTTEDRRTSRIVAYATEEHQSWELHLLGRDELDRRYPGQQLEDRSDHANFVRRGIPAVVIFTGLHEDYHRPGDVAGKINYDALARIVRMGADIAVALADGQE
jgi:Zn-dependent M28 family amino/carboxypeptidase